MHIKDSGVFIACWQRCQTVAVREPLIQDTRRKVGPLNWGRDLSKVPPVTPHITSDFSGIATQDVGPRCFGGRQRMGEAPAGGPGQSPSPVMQAGAVTCGQWCLELLEHPDFQETPESPTPSRIP